MDTPFYGETNCQALIASGINKGENCKNAAYFIRVRNPTREASPEDGKVYCGVHCKKDRVPLEKNPKANENKEKGKKIRDEMIEAAKNKNKAEGKRGKLIVTKLQMMKPVNYMDGFLPVFPNFAHQNRTDGFGCASLSPMALGPVRCFPSTTSSLRQGSLFWESKTLENFHQFSKIYDFEVESNDGEITIFKSEFKDTIKNGFSSLPRRHKYSKKFIRERGGSLNPLYTIFFDHNGKEHRYSYLECRYFYCKLYEKMAKETADFKELQKKLAEGYNLQIVGYDGYDVENALENFYSAELRDILIKYYSDTTRPFGHELVLYTLLTVEKPEMYPWNIFYKENKTIYENVAFDF